MKSSLQPQNTTFTHFMTISKVWFPLGNIQLQKASLHFSNRCFILQSLYQKKVELCFLSILLCKKNWTSSKVLSE